LSAKKNHQRAAAALKKRMGWGGELHSVLPSSGEHVWAVFPEWMIAFDRFSTANDIHVDEVMSIMTKSQTKTQTRQFRAA
jgi:hypothetical protein